MTAPQAGIITVDVQLPVTVKLAAQARVKVMRKQELQQDGVSRTNLSDVCRDILLHWHEDQTNVRSSAHLPDVAQCVHCGMRVGLYENGKLRVHGKIKQRCAPSYVDPDRPQYIATVHTRSMSLPYIPGQEPRLPDKMRCPTCSLEQPVDAEGNLAEHTYETHEGTAKCKAAFVVMFPLSVPMPPGEDGEDKADDKMRFPMNRAKYNEVKAAILEVGQSVAHVLTQRLEHFALTGSILDEDEAAS